MTRAPGFLLAWLVAAAIALTGRAAFADVLVQEDFGHGGAHLEGFATPLDVALTNTSDQPVSVRLSIAPPQFSDSAWLHERTCVVGPGATRRETFLVPGGPQWTTAATVTVETQPRSVVRHGAESGDRGALSFDVGRTGASSPDEPPWNRPVGVLFDSRNQLAPLGAASDRSGASDERHPTPRLLRLGPDVLRLAPLSLDGFEAVVVCDPDASFCAEPAHLDGLLDWVALGGRLVVSLGEHAGDFAASPLAAHLPARWSGSEPRSYASCYAALGLASSMPATPPDGPVARAVRPVEGARTIVHDHSWSRRFGDGEILLLAFDLRAVTRTLPSSEPAVRPAATALFGPPPREEWWARNSWERSEMPVAPPIGRAIQRDAFRPPNVLLVLLGLFAFVLVVGPMDWFILRRLRRERLTTLTFAGAVVAFTALAYGVSMLLFAADDAVNRVTFVQIADGGRGGRAVTRVHDVAGFYAATGASRDLTWPLPAAVVGDRLPGTDAGGGVGASLPVVLRGADPARPAASVEVAFRSQRVIHTVMAGPTGRTLSLVRSADGTYELTNDLPCDLDRAFVLEPGRRVVALGAVRSGGRATGREPSVPASHAWGGSEGESDDAGDASDDATLRFLARLVTATALSPAECPAGWESLRRAAVVRDAVPKGRVRVVALGRALPFPLPGDDTQGHSFMVLTQEFDLP